MSTSENTHPAEQHAHTTARQIGYARIGDIDTDLFAQVNRLQELGVSPDDIYLDQGRIGDGASYVGLQRALEAGRPGDVLVVASLARLAGSLADLEHLTPEIIDRELKLNVGGMVFDPANDVGRTLFDTFRLLCRCQEELAELAEGDQVERMRQAYGQALHRMRATRLN